MVVSSLPPTSNHKRTNQSMDAALVLLEELDWRIGALCFVGIVAALYKDELGTDGTM